MKRYPDRVEDYTNAFLVTAAGILFMAFWTLASTVGFIWVIISSLFLEGCLRLGQAYVRSRQISEDA